jgi:hypothetical protein
MIDRLASYTEYCSQSNPPVELWLSLDTTAVAGERARVETALAAKDHVHGVVRYHEYNETDMVHKFPGLADVRTRVFSKWKGMSLALGYHTEAIDLWWSDPRVVKHQLRWIWIMELDVGFSGPITDLFHNYTDTETDLITHHEGCKKVDKRWLHRFACSKQYKEFVPDEKRYFSLEMTQRFSWRFLNEVAIRMAAGAHAWSEEVGCSTYFTSNMTTMTLRTAHRGAPFTFKHGRAINNKQFFEKWKKEWTRGKLYHPVKGHGS